MHALIVGARGVGKSTLIHRVLSELGRPLFGFETKKESAMEASALGDPIYIYDVGEEHRQAPENLVGYCKNQHATAITEAFDRYADKLMRPIPCGAIVKLDEIGFLEAKAQRFCDAILALLDGSTPVIAAVKDKDIPFLGQVRNHPGAKCFYITQENRDALYEEVLDFMKRQIEEMIRREEH